MTDKHPDDTANLSHVLGYKCVLCGTEYALDDVEYVCPDHGNEGILDVRYDYRAIGNRIDRDALAANLERSIWRYKPILPVAPDAPVPPLRVGWTPLYAARRLAEPLGLKDLWVKDESANPTASFKDRASAIAVVKAQEVSADVITTASTGNAAAALAGLAASIGMQAVIFVPKSAPPAKIAQHLVYGARVLLVDGTYDDAFELALEAAREFGWYNRNTAYNPFMSEGKKTAAYEICEQFSWHPPDRIFVPVGDGCIIGGIHKGLKDLRALGWIDRMPRLMGIQAEGCSPLVDAFEQGRDGEDMGCIEADTVADSICAGLPRDRVKALAAVKQTAGNFLAVSDDEIIAAIPAIAKRTGVFCEPAAAAAYAGLLKALELGAVSADERIVLLLTGSGLKDIDSARKSVEPAPVIPPALDAVREFLASSR